MEVNNSNNRVRSSSIELVRILAMFMIVYYHLILFFIEPIDSNPIFKAIQIPIHIGVILFVLISGYFGIKPSFKGFFKILCVVTIYFLPLRLWYVYKMDMGGWAMLDSLHVLSKTPYWFVRTYLCLYLISPLLNRCLNNLSAMVRAYYIFALVIIAVYLGMLQCDITLIDGKNIANFMLLYIIGDTLKVAKEQLAKISTLKYWGSFVVLNSILISLYMISAYSSLAEYIWNWSFPYYSPLLILNSILFFIPFTRFTFYSKHINYIAGSVFAIYIIHHQPTILDLCLRPISLWLYVSNKPIHVLLLLAILVLFIMIVCIFIDKCLSPLWAILQRCGSNIQNYFSICLKTLLKIQ